MIIINDNLGFSGSYLRDKNLSMKEKGLLTVLSALPASTCYPSQDIASVSQDCITTVKATIRGLEEKGYITRERIRGKDGRLESVVYRVRL